MKVKELSHITLIVRDISKTAELLCRVLGAQELYDSKGKNHSISREKFFLLGKVWLVIMEGEPINRSYHHLAFKVDEQDLPECRVQLEHLGLEIKPSRPRIEGEGHSLYFYDYDNNLFELHTGTLDERLQSYGVQQSWT